MTLGTRDQRIAAAVLGGVALLLFELRFEHREVLGSGTVEFHAIVMG